MVADMGADQAGTSRLTEIYERSAPAGFRLAYLLTATGRSPRISFKSPL